MDHILISLTEQHWTATQRKHKDDKEQGAAQYGNLLKRYDSTYINLSMADGVG